MNTRKYLLGLLSEKQQQKIENAYFTDKALFEKMIAAEDDLVEAYINGKLSRREKKQFDAHLLPQPKWRQKVAAVKALQQVVNEQPAALRPVQADGLAKLFERGREWWASLVQPKRVFALSYAVMLLFVATASLYTLRHVQDLQGKMSVLEQQNRSLRQSESELQSKVREQSARSGEIAALLERERRQRLQMQHELASRQKTALPTFFLQPGLRRDSGEQKRLVLPASDTIRLELPTEIELNYVSYSAVIKTVEGYEVWSSTRLKAGDVVDGQMVVVELPRSLFSHNDYLLSLSGVKQNGDVESIQTYFFSVVE